MGAPADFTTDDLSEMQGLAQRVTTLRPELPGGEAAFGELAWNWGQAWRPAVAPGGRDLCATAVS